MRIFLTCLMWALFSFTGLAHAADSPKTEGQVQLELLKNLQNDGYLSNKLAQEATEKYVNVQSLAAPLAAQAVAQSESPGLWDRYVSWSNAIKVVACLLILYAAWGFLTNFAKLAWPILTMVPTWVYQVPLFAASVYATVQPQVIWASQAFYACFIASVLNLIVISWVALVYPKVAQKLAALFKLGIPVTCIVSFWLTLYFGALALAHSSMFFGFLAAVSFSGMLSFGIAYRPGVLTLDFNDRALPAVVIGHLVVLAGYAAAVALNVLPAQARLFTAGGQVYWSIALGLGFLVACSPWVREPAKPLYFVAFLVTLGASLFGYFMWDLQSVSVILCVFGVLLFLEWIGYIGFQAGVIAGCLIMGVMLYAVALGLERYGKTILAVFL